MNVAINYPITKIVYFWIPPSQIVHQLEIFLKIAPMCFESSRDCIKFYVSITYTNKVLISKIMLIPIKLYSQIYRFYKTQYKVK